MGNKPSRGKALKTAKETKWLDISDNKLRSIPVEVFVTQPRGLNISLNAIMLPEDIGSTLPALEFLDCSGCSLLKLPKSVNSLINLKELILTRNSLSVLPPLPNSLEKLDISYNMFVQVPEHLNDLPNLCWVSLEGNPCYVPNKVLVPLKGKAKIQTIVYGNTEIPVDNSIRLNMKELEILSEVFEDISAPVPGETGMTYIDRDDMMKRMGLSFLPVTTLVDAFFRAFCTYSLPQTKQLFGEIIDVKAFFVGLCVIFKGTVEEKLKFSFDVFDMNGDGFIELQDLKAIAKSALLAALVLTNQYNLTEEEYARYAKEVSRNKLGIEGIEEEQGSNDRIKVLAKEMDLSLLCGTKVLSQLRVQQRSVQDVMNHKAFKAQWPVLKDAIGKQYKEMIALSSVPTNKISFKEYQRYWLSNFSAINEFLNFYGSMFRYGP